MKKTQTKTIPIDLLVHIVVARPVFLCTRFNPKDPLVFYKEMFKLFNEQGPRDKVVLRVGFNSLKQSLVKIMNDPPDRNIYGYSATLLKVISMV